MVRWSLAATAAALTLLLAGCGSKERGNGSKGGGGWAPAPLLDRLPSEASEIIAMDMALAKRQLGVAADLDPRDYERRSGSGTPEAKFDNAALNIVGYVTGVGRTPVAGAIDHGAITPRCMLSCPRPAGS